MDSQSFLKEDRRKHHYSIMFSSFTFVHIIPLSFVPLQVFCKEFFVEFSTVQTHRFLCEQQWRCEVLSPWESPSVLHACCSMTTLAIAACTTLVRSRQSMQLTRKIPSCLQITPAWSTLSTGREKRHTETLKTQCNSSASIDSRTFYTGALFMVALTPQPHPTLN